MADQSSNPEFCVELDVGNLCVLNFTHLKHPIGSKNVSEDTLKHVAASGAQQLLNEIFKLPSEYHEHVAVVKLPVPTTILPRQKHVPKEKPMTKWEKFAKTKGITNKKKDSLIWDDESKGWKSRYGYRGIKNRDDWVMEVPENGDPNIDYFAKSREEKKERVAKNEYKRLRNIATAANIKVTNMESVDRADKLQLSRSLTAAKTATASIGRFAERLPKEKPPKNTMKKKLFKPNAPGNLNKEKENNLKILENLDKKNPKLNVQEAVQRYVTKPLKEGKSDEVSRTKKTRQAKKNKFVKNLYRGGKKPKAFRRP